MENQNTNDMLKLISFCGLRLNGYSMEATSERFFTIKKDEQLLLNVFYAHMSNDASRLHITVDPDCFVNFNDAKKIRNYHKTIPHPIKLKDETIKLAEKILYMLGRINELNTIQNNIIEEYKKNKTERVSIIKSLLPNDVTYSDEFDRITYKNVHMHVSKISPELKVELQLGNIEGNKQDIDIGTAKFIIDLVNV